MVEAGIRDAFDAIRAHPVSVVDVFERGRDAFDVGMAGASETEWSKAAGLTMTELATVHR